MLVSVPFILDYASWIKFDKKGQVLMVKAPVLDPIEPDSIITGGFREGNDFITRHGIFGGRPP
jgi:hypothetical protein